MGGLGGEDNEWGRGKFVHEEQRLRWIGGGLGCFSRYYNIIHISLRIMRRLILVWSHKKDTSGLYGLSWHSKISLKPKVTLRS